MAEGVETDAQYRYRANAVCAKIRLYLASPPLPLNDVRALKDAGVKLGRLPLGQILLAIIDLLQ